MDAAFEYSFPAIRGIQAKREYYVSMCPLRLIPRIFLFDEDELLPELRAQRTLNRVRLPEMARYLTDNRDDYVFSAITASIDGDARFQALAEGGDASRVGVLHIPMQARFIINDGQHRRAAIEIALREDPDLGDETIAVVFFMDKGLHRSQQMFADLNRHAVRPSPSLGILYEHREEMAQLAKMVVAKSPVFRDVVELERSTLSLRSRKLFTLSAIYSGTKALVEGMDGSLEERVAVAVRYWERVARLIPEWNLVRARKMTAGDVRRDFIHSHGIVLQALGSMGSALIRAYPDTWPDKLEALAQVDWSRSNSALWEGRATIGGRVSKSRQNVILTTNVLKRIVGLPLAAAEQELEERHGHA